MKTRTALALLLLAALAAPGPRRGRRASAGAPKLPYVYTNWKQFTVADGLPNDHIFAVKVDGPRVWVGTEDGLALIDKPTGEGREDVAGEGRPAVQGRHRDRRGREDGRRVARPLRRRPRPPLRRPLRPLAPAQQRARQRRGVRRRDRERQRLGGDHRRRLAAQHGDGRVDGLHREERADGGDLELRRELRRQGLGLPRGVGQRASSSTTSRPATGRSTSIPTARWRSTSTATTGSTT